MLNKFVCLFNLNFQNFIFKLNIETKRLPCLYIDLIDSSWFNKFSYQFDPFKYVLSKLTRLNLNKS